MSYDCQDWTPVVMHNKSYHKSQSRQKQNPAGTKQFRALDNYTGGEDAPPPLKTITQEQARILREARNAKGLDMKGLVKLVPYLDVKTIQEYENGNTKNFNASLYKKMLNACGVKPDGK
jgi:ribosome-binding protein aMBF1 (putative translation factor)